MFDHDDCGSVTEAALRTAGHDDQSTTATTSHRMCDVDGIVRIASLLLRPRQEPMVAANPLDHHRHKSMTVFPAAPTCFERLRSRTGVDGRIAALVGHRLPLSEFDPNRLGGLRRRFPWALGAVETIEADLLQNDRRSLGPYLIWGAPGIGKSEFAACLCECLNAAWGGVAARSATPDCLIGGPSDSMMPEPIRLIIEAGVANPVIVVDGLDRVADGSRLPENLIDLIDHPGRRHHRNAWLDGSVDLSAVSWIVVVNTPARLPASLRDVLTPIRFPPPGPRDAAGLVTALWRDAIAGLDSIDVIDLPAADEMAAIAGLWAENGAPSIRALKRIVRRWIALRDRGAVRH